jgi:hypothetical protein
MWMVLRGGLLSKKERPFCHLIQSLHFISFRGRSPPAHYRSSNPAAVPRPLSLPARTFPSTRCWQPTLAPGPPGDTALHPISNPQYPIPNRKSKIPNPKSGYCFAEKKTYSKQYRTLRQNLTFPKHDGSWALKMPHNRPIYGMRDRKSQLIAAHFPTVRTSRSSLSRIIPIPGTIPRPTQRNGPSGGAPYPKSDLQYPISNAVVKLTHLRYNARPVQRTGTDHR